MFEKKFVRSLIYLVVVLSLSATATRGANILFVSSMDPAHMVGDDALKAFMEGLGHTVTYIDDGVDEAATEAAAISADMVFISESCGSGNIKNEITELAVPMIVGEPYAWDEMGLTEGGGGDNPAATTNVEIVAPGHYLAAGLSGTVAVLTDIISALGGCNLGKGIVGPEATVIATATLSDGQTYAVIFVYEKGAALPVAPADGSPQVAADIRIGFGFHLYCDPLLNENAYALLGAAVDYALGLTEPPAPEPKVPVVVDIRIANGLDDHEERVSSGKMDAGSSDLEFAYETGGTPAKDEQLIGLRFVSIAVPKGAQITGAYVEIEVDKVNKEGSQAPVNLIIEGELTPDAAPFADTDFNISQRLPSTTTAKVKWSVPPWTAENEKFQTTDISSIIQEIVNQDGWVGGNALVLIFRDDKENPSTGLREAEAFEGEAPAAPLLHIEYTEAAVEPPAGPASLVSAFAFGSRLLDCPTFNDPTVKYTMVHHTSPEALQYDPARGYGYEVIYPVDSPFGDRAGYGKFGPFDDSPNNRNKFPDECPEQIYDSVIGAKSFTSEVSAVTMGDPNTPSPTPEGIIFRVDVPNGLYRFVGAFGDADNVHAHRIMAEDGGSGPPVNIGSNNVVLVSNFDQAQQTIGETDAVKLGEGVFARVGFDGKIPPPGDGVAPSPQFANMDQNGKQTAADASSPILEVTSGYIRIHQLQGNSNNGPGGPRDANGGDIVILELWKVGP